jgi:type II secretory pathway pseudopilin PulG
MVIPGYWIRLNLRAGSFGRSAQPVARPRIQTDPVPILGIRQTAGERGYNLVVLVVIITIMNIVLAAVLPLWSQAIRRNNEEELIFRGLQYAEAIRVFHNRFQRWPTRLEELVEVKPRSIRQLWKDPMTDDGKWQLIFEGREQVPISVQPGPDGRPTGRSPIKPGTAGLDQQGQSFGPIKGVYSRSTRKSVLIWGGREQYDQWRFNADLLNGGGRAVFGSAAVPTGTQGAPAGQNLLSVRWIGRPWRTLGALKDNIPVGGIGEPINRPGGIGTATPGAPGVPRTPQPPQPSPNGQPRF